MEDYSPWFGSTRVPNSSMCPHFLHITGTGAVPSTGSPSTEAGSGVEMTTCSGPTENCPWLQTVHPCKPLDTRKFSIRSLLCCPASDAMLLPSMVRRMLQPGALLMCACGMRVGRVQRALSDLVGPLSFVSALSWTRPVVSGPHLLCHRG